MNRERILLDDPDLKQICTDCGLAGWEFSRKEVVAKILEWQVRARDGSACRPGDCSLQHATPAPTRAPPGESGSLLSLDPLCPVKTLVSYGSLSSDTKTRPNLASVRLQFTKPKLGKGERLELRMARRKEPGRHLWPKSLVVYVGGCEVARVDPPR